MVEHADQHYVPHSYLKRWCDPDTPAGQTPYVWRISKDGSERRKKAPKNIFTETDMYTVKAADGTRDLTLEHGLSQLEGDFCTVREKLESGAALSVDDRMIVSAFTAATQARTKAQRDHQAGQWSKVFDLMKSMKAQFETSTPEQREALSRFSPSPDEERPSLSFSDVQKIVEQPAAALLLPTVAAATPILMQMDMGIVITDDRQGFITSDDPCVWYDPELVRLPPFYRHPALTSSTIEVILPIGPSRMLLFNRRGFNSVFSAPKNVIDFYNRVVRFEADEYFVSNADAVDPYWFEEEPLPTDAWENTRGGEKSPASQ
jgi:hypothetical protein